MTEEKDDKPDVDGMFARLKAMVGETVNEVLDEREVKAEEARTASEKDKTDPETKRTDAKPTIMQTLFGG